MPPQDPTNSAPVSPTPPAPPIHNPLAVIQPGEQTIFEIKRHPIGIFMIYAMTVIMLIALTVLGLIVAPGLSSGGGSSVKTFATAGLVVVTALSLVFNLLATTIYWGNRWILTSDSITQYSQTGLFHKENSQIQLDSVEDVTAAQNGILQRIFNYGTLKVETAGHGINYAFAFAPKPNIYAKQILEAREQEHIENNRLSDSPGPPSYTVPPVAQPPAGPIY